MSIKIITVHYTSNGIPQTGLVPTINVYQLDPTNPAVNTLVVTNGIVSEIGQGWYRYNFATYDPTQNYVFTVDGGIGLNNYDRYKYGGNESYAEDITTAVLNEPVINHTTTGSVADTLLKTKADTSSILVSETNIMTLVDVLLKYQRNKTKIDVTNAQLIIFDNDATTPLTTFNLLDSNGVPSVQEVCQRIPV